MHASEVRASISDFSSAFEAVPEVSEPPSTTLTILRKRTSEKYWSRLLQYFLDPSASHGMGSDFLDQFSQLIEKRTDAIGLSDSELKAVEVESEIRSDNGRPDLLLFLDDEWFICIELKVTASETGRQTKEYAASSRLGDVTVSDYQEENRHYLYLAKKQHSPPASKCFSHIYWRDISEIIDNIFNNSRGQYPVRSSAQLSDFQCTIRDEIMNDQPYDNQQSEYVELYIENMEAIDAVRSAFGDMIDTQLDEWATRFQEQYQPDSWNESWNCSSEKYGKIYKDEWRRDKNGNIVSDWSEAALRLEFRHQIRKERSWKEGEVIFEAVIPKNSNDTYRNHYHELFLESVEDLQTTTESTNITIKGNSRTLTRTAYSFEPSEGPEGYYESLSEAFEEHMILVPVLSDIFDATRRDIV